MNVARRWSSFASMLIALLGAAAFAPAAFADENESRHVRTFLARVDADESAEVETPLPRTLTLKKLQDDNFKDEYRRADFRRVKDKNEPGLIDFRRFEMGGIAGIVGYTSKFEADPSYVVGVTARLPIPAIPLGDWGAWAQLTLSYVQRDLPFYYTDKSGNWIGAAVGGDYTFIRDEIWYLRGQLGVLYANWGGVQALDDGLGVLAGGQIGFYWIRGNRQAVVTINPQLSYDGESAIVFFSVGFSYDF